MPHLVRQDKRSKKSKALGEPDVVNCEDYEAMELDSRLELIGSLIPTGSLPAVDRGVGSGEWGVGRRPNENNHGKGVDQR